MDQPAVPQGQVIVSFPGELVIRDSSSLQPGTRPPKEVLTVTHQQLRVRTSSSQVSDLEGLLGSQHILTPPVVNE